MSVIYLSFTVCCTSCTVQSGFAAAFLIMAERDRHAKSWQCKCSMLGPALSTLKRTQADLLYSQRRQFWLLTHQNEQALASHKYLLVH